MNFDLAGIMPTGKISKDRANYFKQGSYQKIVGADFAWSCKDRARQLEGQMARRLDGQTARWPDGQTARRPDG